MNDKTTPYHWFWSEFDQQTADSLNPQQRKEIDRVIARHDQATARKDASDIRLTFGWYYLVIRWGREQRSWQRLKNERKKWPVFTRANTPVLAVIWMTLFFGIYAVMAASMRGLIMMFS